MDGLTTHDIKLSARQRRRELEHFEKVRRAESGYARQLRKIARHVGDIIRAFTPGDTATLPELINTLSRYADILRPWARSSAATMLAEVSKRDEQAWFKTSKLIGYELKKEIRDTPIGDLVRQILAEQVHLITSIPLEAGQRVQELTQEYVAGGRRYVDLVPMILNSGNVSVARATLVARTEVGKAASALTQARALHIGSTHYIWCTSRDYKVRRTHKRLEGTVHSWNDPPIAEENGERHHPGQFPNCRCFAEPILPTKFT